MATLYMLDTLSWVFIYSCDEKKMMQDFQWNLALVSVLTNTTSKLGVQYCCVLLTVVYHLRYVWRCTNSTWFKFPLVNNLQSVCGICVTTINYFDPSTLASDQLFLLYQCCIHIPCPFHFSCSPLILWTDSHGLLSS